MYAKLSLSPKYGRVDYSGTGPRPMPPGDRWPHTDTARE